MTNSAKARRDLTRLSMLVATLGAVSVIAIVLTGIARAAHVEPEPGHHAPAFTGLTSSGETISLDQFAGKTVVLEWTNHGCPFVQKHYNGDNMQSTQRVAAADEDIVWISIISSAPGTQGYVSAQEANTLSTERNAVPDYVILDPSGEIGQSYKAITTPHMFVIDGDGMVQYNGAMDDKPSTKPSSLDGATNYTLNAINAMQAGEPINPARTKPYGCSVKYKS